MGRKKKITVYDLIDLMETSIVGTPAYQHAVGASVIANSAVTDCIKSFKLKYNEEELKKMAPTSEELERANAVLEAHKAAIQKEAEEAPEEAAEAKPEEEVVEEKPVAEEAKEEEVVEEKSATADLMAEIQELRKAIAELQGDNKIAKEVAEKANAIPVRKSGYANTDKVVGGNAQELPVYKRGETNEAEFFAKTAQWAINNQPNMWALPSKEE